MYHGNNYRIGQDILWIAVAWGLSLVTLRLLQISGAPVGFDVWPMGEDRNWLSWMQRADGSGIAQQFWQMNDRNPVSPWWYVVFKPLIMVHDSGILLTRYLMSLLCGVASYLCIRGVGGLGARWFALATGVLCAIFTANGYIDNIHWNFIGALSMSLLCVWAYTRFLDSGRAAQHWYGVSLILWFFALSTYTLQSGAVLAIGYLAYASPQQGSRNLFTAPVARGVRTIQDCLAYFGVFAIFLLIWKTTASPSMASYYSTKFTGSQLFTSLAMSVWHKDFLSYSGWAGRSLSLGVGAVASILFAGATYLLMRLALRSDEAQERRIVLSARSGFDILVVGFCLVVPTILVEASSVVWGPGTRWRMVHQFWVPLYLTAILAIVYVVISRISARKFSGMGVWALLVGLASASIIAINLGHNEEQVLTTASEKNLKNELTRILESEPNIGHFIVKLEPGASWISSDTMSHIYAKTFFSNRTVTLRIIPSVPAPDPYWEPWWTIKFKRDGEGIANAMVGGGTATYQETRVLAFNGKRARSLQGATANEFTGLAVVWERDSPLPDEAHVSAGSDAACSFAWAATDPTLTTGFSVPEKDNQGSFRWTIAKRAGITFPACDGPFQVVVRAAVALSDENVRQFSVIANGTPIPLERSRTADGAAYVGNSPKGTNGEPLTLELAVPNLDRPAGDTRELGIAIREVKVRPAPTER